MERYLFYMKALGLVEPEEERHQWVFHIMVSGRYADWRETQDVVPFDRAEPATLAADSSLQSAPRDRPFTWCFRLYNR